MQKKVMSFRENSNKYLIWVMAPVIETEDANLEYYYDYTQSVAEYERVFAALECEWHWVNVTMKSFERVIRDISDHQTSRTKVVINLCDGDEINGIPGVSVIDVLERYGLIYTGANNFFYSITTSKIPMKEAFDRHGIKTPAWKVIDPYTGDLGSLFQEIGKVLIVKPAISAGSLGLSTKNVVSGEEELKAVLTEMEAGYHGWKLDSGGIFVEEFIEGREFTTLVVGSSTQPESLRFYPPAERVFHASLPEREKFLSFDRLWETYEQESPMSGNEHLYEYDKPEGDLVSALRNLSLQAYTSVGGMGYGRLDIRMDSQTGKLYVLEINAQCGLSEDENYTSIGAILRFAEKSFTYLIIEIIEDGIARYGAKHSV